MTNDNRFYTVDGETVILLNGKFHTCNANVMFLWMVERFMKYG